MTRSALSLAVALLLAVPAGAQSDDVAYCAKLSDLASRYLGGRSGEVSEMRDLNISMAIEQCRTGNTAAGIPTLEGRLRKNGFSLPKRS